MSIAVYGDVIVDEYIYGTSTRLSPEAPVPVVDFIRNEFRMGGAANVFENIKSLVSEKVTMNTSSPNPPIKKRVFADDHYVTRIDITPESIKWENTPSDADVIVISDYNKGAVADLLCDIEDKLPFKEGAKIIVDPKRHLEDFAGAWCIKPNKKEFEDYIGAKVTVHTIRHYMERAYPELGIEHLIVTMGGDGVAYYSTEKGFRHWPANLVEVSDVTGAGDTFTAVLAYAVDDGYDIIDAIFLANKAAGIAVQHHGTYVITKEDLGIKKEVVVFTNGCFDILHPGHVHTLREAKKLGSRLIVGINTDESVRRLKGPARPINSFQHRVAMLYALKIADIIVAIDDDTPYSVIKSIEPDIIVKGGDYTPEQVVGADLVEKVVIIPTLESYSTTNIIERIKDAS